MSDQTQTADIPPWEIFPRSRASIRKAMDALLVRPGGEEMSPNICPTCKQPIPPRRELIWSADQLVAAMRIPPPPSDDKKFPRGETRDVYEGYENGKIPTGRFYLTYGEGIQVRREAIAEALRRGLIRLKYDDCGGYWCLA